MADEQKPQEQPEPETGKDYKALYEQSQKQLEAAQAETARWKNQSRKQESRAKSNASAAKDLEEANAQLADLSQRIAAIEGENEALKAKT